MFRLSNENLGCKRFAALRARLPRFRAVATGITCIALLGCFDDRQASHRHGSKSHRVRAWFDAKGACVFPLVTDSVPSSRQQLIDALTAGWMKNLKFPSADPQFVTADGGKFPSVSKLHMDLGGARMDLTRDNKKNKPAGKVEGQLFAADFELDGRPLLADRAKMNLHFAATRARLDFEHDEGGRPVLMLADAHRARLDFEATRPDLERILLVTAREAGRKYGVSVDRIDLKLTALTPHALTLDLHLSTRVGFIPAGMRFQARVDIDSNMNARLSHLQCDGDEALGPLIVGIIRPGLEKYNGKSKPVFSFPTGELQLRDVQIRTDGQIRVTALFGA